jgi:flagellar hook assembly protein FlgD
VKVTIETPEGIVVRAVSNSQLQAGAQSVTWDGRAGNRKPVAGGAYVAKVAATNELGAVSLTQPLTVRRSKR